MEDANGELLGYGSGFFVRSNQIVTNFHVIDGAAQGTAKLVDQETEYAIEGITAMDESHDLAILQVTASGVQPLPLGDSDAVEIGETVYVAGNPKGYFEGTFSDGIISAVRGDSTSKRLQMTAPVSSGSSGGPVLNGSGEVIGVSFATFRGGQNLNFAIPSNYLKELLVQLGTAKPLQESKDQQVQPMYGGFLIDGYDFKNDNSPKGTIVYDEAANEFRGTYKGLKMPRGRRAIFAWLHDTVNQKTEYLGHVGWLKVDTTGKKKGTFQIKVPDKFKGGNFGSYEIIGFTAEKTSSLKNGTQVVKAPKEPSGSDILAKLKPAFYLYAALPGADTELAYCGHGLDFFFAKDLENQLCYD